MSSRCTEMFGCILQLRVEWPPAPIAAFQRCFDFWLTRMSRVSWVETSACLKQVWGVSDCRWFKSGPRKQKIFCLQLVPRTPQPSELTISSPNPMRASERQSPATRPPHPQWRSPKRPRLPSGSLRLCSIPALKPSSERPNPATQTFDIFVLSSTLCTYWYVAGRRNQSYFSVNHFRKPCNHPNL